MPQTRIEMFQMQAEFNRRANRRQYDACATLDEDSLRSSLPGFRINILGMLNHMLIGDLTWMARFTGGEVPSTGLWDILYESFDDLRHAREAEDERIVQFINGLQEPFLQNEISYLDKQGNPHCDPAALLLMHFFNHHTHHRSLVNSMLKTAGIQPPMIDMLLVMRSNSQN